MPRKFCLPLVALAACLTAQACSSTQANSAQAGVYPTAEIPCPDVVPPGETEGETITCGTITVPENYDEPDGRQIDITYAKLHSFSNSPASDPVVDLRGGPGGSAIAFPSLEQRAGFYTVQRQTRDVILFDQRGTQFSNRLGCGPVGYAVVVASQDPTSEIAQQIDALLQQVKGIFPEASEDAAYAYTMQLLCGILLEANGADLDQYDSPNSAQDVVNLTAALGYDDINLYGISYGTYLAQQVMRDHPERLRSVVLDSTLTAHVDKYEAIPLDAEVAFLNVVEDCEADADCAAAYPNLKQRTIDLLAQLEAAPIPFSNRSEALPPDITEVTATGVAGVLTTISSNPTQLPQYVPLLIHELEQRTTSTLDSLITGQLFATEQTPPLPDSLEAYRLQEEQFRLEAEKLLRVAAQEAQFQRPSSQWVAQVETQFAALPESEKILELVNFYGVGYQSDKPRDRATLLAYVKESFDGDAAQALTDSLSAMSEVEVDHIYDVISMKTDEVFPQDDELTIGMHYSMDCREMTAFSTAEEITAAYERSELPLLGAARYDLALTAVNICSLWPVEPAPASEHEPVESDVPTLVLQGRYDAITNTEVGARVTEGLSNSTYVEFSSSGHGVIAYSQCAKDVGAAFVANPDQPLDMSCTENLFPDFVLPSSASETAPQRASSPATTLEAIPEAAQTTAEAEPTATAPYCLLVNAPVAVFGSSPSAAIAGQYQKNDIAYATTNPPTTQQADGKTFIEVSIYDGLTGWVPRTVADGSPALIDLTPDQCS